MQHRSIKQNLTGLEKTVSELTKKLQNSKDHNNTLKTTNLEIAKENKDLVE